MVAWHVAFIPFLALRINCFVNVPFPLGADDPRARLDQFLGEFFYLAPGVIQVQGLNIKLTKSHEVDIRYRIPDHLIF